MPRFVSEISTGALREILDPAYEEKLNCPLEEHVLRLMAVELLRNRRSGNMGMTQEQTDHLVGFIAGRRTRCEHGRSVFGTCGDCDGVEDDEEE